MYLKKIVMQIRSIFTTYAIVRMEDLSKIDFSQTGIDSADTIRKNLLDPPTQFIICWDSEPTFITDGTVIPDGLYTHQEILEETNTEIWTDLEVD